MGAYILAHDLGTSGNKASLFTAEGELIGSEVYAYGVCYFNGTWAEQDADDWWKAVCMTTAQLIRKTGTDPKDIAAVSFSGQMMGCLCVDREGRPLRRSIIWADQRALEQAAALDEKMDRKAFFRITGHRNSASYGVQKLMWVRDNEPEIYRRTYKVLNAKDYIVFRLTGLFYTDYSDANSMDCFDINRLEWSQEILSAAGVDAGKLPRAVSSIHVAGTVTTKAAARTGLAAGTPVVVGCGDGVSANVGAGSIEPGNTYCCMGTSAWISAAAEKPVIDDAMRTVTWVHAVPGLYTANGTMQTAGGAYSWLKNTVCDMERYTAGQENRSVYDIINEEIERSPAGAGGVIFLPYLLGERAPRWNHQAKGAFLGLKAETTRADMLRSVLEGVTLNLSVILEILRTHVPITDIMAVGGGAKGRVWRQIMADIFGTRILVPRVLEEAGSMGAAVVAGVGAGLFDDFHAIDRFLEITDVQEPDPQAAAAYKPVKELFEACYQALEPVFPLMR